MIAVFLQNNSQTCTPRGLLGMCDSCVLSKGLKKKKKKVEKMRKETGQTSYPLEYTVLPSRYSLPGFLVFYIFNTFSFLKASVFEEFPLSSVQQWNICICAIMRITVFVLGMIKEKNQTICRLRDLDIILKEK